MENLTANEINGIIIFLTLILQLIGIAIAVAWDVNLGKKRRIVMGTLIGLALTLLFQNYAEYFLVEYVSAPMWRTFVAALGYSVRPAIIVLLVYMIAPKRKNWWMWIPVGINCIMYNTAYFSHVVFYINENNSWVGGPLSNLCLIVSSILLAYHIVIGALEFRNEKTIGKIMPIIFTLVVVAGIILDAYKNYRIQHWVDYVTISVVACCVFYYLWLHFVFVQRYQDAIDSEARYNTMRSQLQPHFLYNALSAISMIDGMPKEGKRAILDFSQYLRKNLDAMTSSELISFDKELDHINKYISLEKLRFGERVNAVFDVKCSNFRLPALTVQMLVENAVKHGITKKGDGGTVRVSSEQSGKNYIVTVEDDGVGFDMEKEIFAGHYGVSIIKKRLEYAVNGKLVITSEVGKGTTAKVFVPIGKTRRQQQ